MLTPRPLLLEIESELMLCRSRQMIGSLNLYFIRTTISGTLRPYAGILLISLILYFPAQAAEGYNGWVPPKQCSGTLKWVKGRFYSSNGTPSLRLQDFEVKDTYGILHDGYVEGWGERYLVPPDLWAVLTSETNFTGDFLFCITTSQKGFFDLGYIVKWLPNFEYEK